ncbi:MULTISPECIES: FecR family protein [unclassified Myroides]|uniref:FecR family protein n=1 Tax=unclassified Myroides TaxID=2642485 RepID=UPI0015F9F787|nr:MULTISPECIES: FecR family protein [unclassified Myroides]MBB1151174.1 FecR family protein [Myroides sp. NP-2]MDM1408708.1 FecR family protein [Myroides sp. DF42-4-2]
MINKFRQLCEKYLNQTATQAEQKVVDDFIQELQKQAFTTGELVREDKQLKQRIFSSIKFKTVVRKKKQRRQQTLLLLVAFLGLICTSLWLTSNFIFKDTLQYTVARGDEPKRFVLDDATEVELMPGSQLILPSDFNAVDRRVTLEGEAFFNVNRNATKPFIVHTEQVSVTVLGTSFTVRASEVVVRTGKVTVENQKDTLDKVWLNAHEKTTLFDGRLHSSTVDVLTLISTNKEELVMHELPLITWKKRIEEEFNVQLHFEGISTTDFFTTGDFRHTSLKDILHSFCFIHQVRYTVSGAAIHFENEWNG